MKGNTYPANGIGATQGSSNSLKRPSRPISRRRHSLEARRRRLVEVSGAKRGAIRSCPTQDTAVAPREPGEAAVAGASLNSATTARRAGRADSIRIGLRMSRFTTSSDSRRRPPLRGRPASARHPLRRTVANLTADHFAERLDASARSRRPRVRRRLRRGGSGRSGGAGEASSRLIPDGKWRRLGGRRGGFGRWRGSGRVRLG